jgi:hypothetical protein
LRKRAMARAERAMAMKTKRVIAMAKKRVVACKSDGNGKEDGDGK